MVVILSNAKNPRICLSPSNLERRTCLCSSVAPPLKCTPPAATTAPTDLERLAIEAAAAAALAQHLYIRQEAHFNPALPGAVALGAATTAGIERKTAGVGATPPRLAGAGEHAADFTPENKT